jgi:hypothetical protein
VLQTLTDKVQGRAAITRADPAPQFPQRLGKPLHGGIFEGVPHVIGGELGGRIVELGGDLTSNRPGWVLRGDRHEEGVDDPGIDQQGDLNQRSDGGVHREPGDGAALS